MKQNWNKIKANNYSFRINLVYGLNMEGYETKITIEKISSNTIYYVEYREKYCEKHRFEECEKLNNCIALEQTQCLDCEIENNEETNPK